MGIAQVNTTTGYIEGWSRWDIPASGPGQTLVTEVDSPPDPDSQIWDGVNSLRTMTSQEQSDYAEAKLQAEKDDAITAVESGRGPTAAWLKGIVKKLVEEINETRVRLNQATNFLTTLGAPVITPLAPVTKEEIMEAVKEEKMQQKLERLGG